MAAARVRTLKFFKIILTWNHGLSVECSTCTGALASPGSCASGHTIIFVTHKMMRNNMLHKVHVSATELRTAAALAEYIGEETTKSLSDFVQL